MTEVKRPYRSPRRQKQAEATRRKILSAARRLFVDRGYGNATMEAIAEKAGVAVQTVYASLGSKRGILMALLDEMASDADLEGMKTSVAGAAGHPRRQLRLRLDFAVRLYAAGADLIEIARTVSGVEPDLREMWREGEGRRLANVIPLVAEWEAAGALAPGVSKEEATDLFWALAGADVFHLFVTERGWTQEHFRERIAQTLERMLFREDLGA